MTVSTEHNRLSDRRGEWYLSSRLPYDIPLVKAIPITVKVPMPRPLRLPEPLMTRFPSGTLAAIDATGIDRQVFVRAAVARAIETEKCNRFLDEKFKDRA